APPRPRARGRCRVQGARPARRAPAGAHARGHSPAMRAPRLSTFLLLPLLLAVTCGSEPVAQFGIPEAGGGLPVTVLVRSGEDPAALGIRLDDVDVRGLFAPGPQGLVGTLPLPAPGKHVLAVVAGSGAVLRRQSLEVPAPTPALTGAAPAAGAIATTSWLRFDFAEDVDAAMLTGFAFEIVCGGERVGRAAYAVEGRSVVIDPVPDLPAGACRVVWRE